MPQSSAALRSRATALRLLRNPHTAVNAAPQAASRPIWARQALACQHGACKALEVRGSALWVLVQDASGQEAWAPIARILTPEQRRGWASGGFG